MTIGARSFCCRTTNISLTPAPTASGSWKQARSNRLTATSTITTNYPRASQRWRQANEAGPRQSRAGALDRDENSHAAKNAARLDKRISAIEEKMGKFRDLVSRIDKALAGPAVIYDPAKAALLSSQHGELSECSLRPKTNG